MLFLEIKELERKSEGSPWPGLTNECRQCPLVEKAQWDGGPRAELAWLEEGQR